MMALVFGGAGQVGRALTASAPVGLDVVPVDRGACDVSDEASVRGVIARYRPDVVFNASGYTNVDQAESDPRAAASVNAEAPGYIAAAARAAGARNVHLSTDFVFGGKEGRPHRPDDPTEPTSVYAQTKLAGERAVATADPAALVVRAAWIYAPWGHNFVNTMLRLMRTRDTVRVVSDQVGTPTWAPGLARALWRLVDKGAAGLHHYTDAGVASWYDLAVAIAEEGQSVGLVERPVEVVPIPTAEYPTPAARPAYSVLDKSLTWAITGRPPHWRVNLRSNFQELLRDA